MIKKLLLPIILPITSTGCLVGVFLAAIKPALDEAQESKTQADLESIRDLVLLIEKEKGKLPTHTEMKIRLEPTAKDIYGNPYVFEYIDTKNQKVFIIKSYGKDGAAGGFGKNRDQILIYAD